jgi:hypothetical protein
MLRTPTDLEQDSLVHLYDPLQAHEYYLRTRKLKGRQKGSGEQPSGFAKANQRRHESARTKQKKELQASIQRLTDKLNKLEALIRKREHESASEHRKSKAKKERSAKDKDKPKSAAEKAKASRESEKYRDKHKQELKSKAKKDASKSGGGDSSKGSKDKKKHSVTELKALATKVKGQIAVAKQKLAAL